MGERNDGSVLEIRGLRATVEALAADLGAAEVAGMDRLSG